MTTPFERHHWTNRWRNHWNTSEEKPLRTHASVKHTAHERKSLMAVLSDGFIAMPGGFGTLEEIIEVITWGQLGFHDKPCGLLNVAGYFDQLLAFLDHSQAQGFLHAEHRRMLLVADAPAGLLEQFEAYVPPKVEKWRNDSG